MRTPARPGRGSIGFNMTPMIDVVFQLIIFFLVSSRMAQQENLVSVDLPDAVSSKQAEQEEARRLVINVLSETQVLVGSRPIEPSRLESVLQYESRRSEGAGSGRPLEVRIRTDRTVPYRAIEPILLACARSGIWDVKFAVINNSR
ncbi:MAG: ExbD/TolR family protein [Thermoguttaceae bacterium]